MRFILYLLFRQEPLFYLKLHFDKALTRAFFIPLRAVSLCSRTGIAELAQLLPDFSAQTSGGVPDSLESAKGQKPPNTFKVGDFRFALVS